MRYTKFLPGIALFFAGLACGGYLFDESVPRSFLALRDCGIVATGPKSSPG